MSKIGNIKDKKEKEVRPIILRHKYYTAEISGGPFPV